jgi:hypothetical protein
MAVTGIAASADAIANALTSSPMRLGHVQGAAHLRQQPGREQVGHHVGEGRGGQG